MSAKPLYGASTAITVAGLNGLVNGGITDSVEINNTTELALSKFIEINLVGLAGETGYVSVSAKEGLATGTLEDNGNVTNLGTVKLNGTVPVRKVLHYDNVSPFYTLSFKMNSSATNSLAATGNSVNTLSENIQDI